MWVIGSINQGFRGFNDTRLNLVQTPFFKLAEIALLAAVVYHGLDGIRLLMVNWFKVTDYRKSLFYAVLALFCFDRYRQAASQFCYLCWRQG